MNLDTTLKGALMADAHTGYSLPIGAVVATDGIVYPSWVGYDIGCGMCAIITSFDRDEVRDRSRELMERIYDAVPVGFKHQKTPQAWPEANSLKKTPVINTQIEENGALKQLGTLGGGNHFIEIGSNEHKIVYVVIHSGSRNLGHRTATHYMKLASPDGKAREGHFGFGINSEDGKAYLEDMNFCLEFALENRKRMLKAIEAIMENMFEGEFFWDSLINRTHNHAEVSSGTVIHRKGATHAEHGMEGVIPGNMKDGSFIVRGKGDPEALFSSSHGAGRVMSRKQAKESFTLSGLESTMDGICARLHEGVLDESPGAYKNIYEVMELQKDLVDVITHVKPITSLKG